MTRSSIAMPGARSVQPLARLLLVLAAAAWLIHATLRFLAPSFPGYGLWIGVPMDGSVRFERGTLTAVAGSVRAVDFSPWWLPSILASVAVLAAFAVRGCVAGRRRGS